MFWKRDVVIRWHGRMSGYGREWGLASEPIKLKMFFMFKLKILNVFEFLGLERVNPKHDSTFKVLHQPFLKVQNFTYFRV